MWPPTFEQRLLLGAALLDSPHSLKAWRSWRERVPVETENLDPGSYRLLPLVWRSLHSLAADDPLMGRLHGIWRRTWYLNQRWLPAARQVAHFLERAGVPTLLLGRAAVSALTDSDYGSRLFDPLTLLVLPEHARLALQVLAGSGWRCQPAEWGALDFELVASCSLADPAGEVLRLKWRLMEYDRRVSTDDAVWANSKRIDDNSWPALLPAPADLAMSVVEAILQNPAQNLLPGLADLWAIVPGVALEETAHARRLDGLFSMLQGYLAGLSAHLPALQPPADELCAALWRPDTRLNRLRLRWALFQASHRSDGVLKSIGRARHFPRVVDLHRRSQQLESSVKPGH